MLLERDPPNAMAASFELTSPQVHHNPHIIFKGWQGILQTFVISAFCANSLLVLETQDLVVFREMDHAWLMVLVGTTTTSSSTFEEKRYYQSFM